MNVGEGVRLNVIVTSSDDSVHGGLTIVHLSTYVLPATPVNVLVGLLAAVTFPPVPLTILQLPVPITGTLAVSVVIVIPHIPSPV